MSSAEELSKEFHSLDGNSVSERRKRLNYYIKKIKTNVKSEDDLNLLTKSITPTNELERCFKVEVLLQLQRNDQILDILKGTDSMLIAKIYKNYKFFSDVFSNMDCHTFFTDITPYISHSCMMKIITRLSKVLTSENLADEYFNAVRDKYGIRKARMLLPACSSDLVKSATQTYKIFLTSKELLVFARKNEDFLRFYFDILPTFNISFRFEDEYKKIAQYVGRTDADLFWKLQGTYAFNYPNREIYFGESVFDFLFAHDEVKATNRKICIKMFNPRRVYNVLSKRGKLDVLLGNFCHGDENEFYRMYVGQKSREFLSIQMFLDRMPKRNYFRYLNGAFKFKFGKNLLDYPKYFNKDILRSTPKSEREQILDKITKENDDFIYLYDIKRSIPLLKEILDKNVENPDAYLKQLYRSCKFHRDQDGLLDVSKYIVEKYRHREHLINEISMKMVRWPNAGEFKPEIWNLIDEMVAIVEYSDDNFTTRGFTDYLQKHIINSVDNNVPFGKLFRKMLNRKIDDFLNFDKYTGNIKRYCEETCKLMTDMRKRDEFIEELYYLLSTIFEFNSKNKNDKISLLDYGHLLEICRTKDFIAYGARDNVHNSFHDMYWKIFRNTCDHENLVAYARNQPEIVFKNVDLLDLETVAPLRNISFSFFTVAMRSEIFQYCMDILTLNEGTSADRVAVAFTLLSLINEEEFFNVVKRTDLAKLHEMDDSIHLLKRVLFKCLKSSSKLSEFLPTAINVYRDTKTKNYLSPIHTCLHKIPLYQVKALLKQFSESTAVHFRRLSVTLAYILLTKSELCNWIKEVNKNETDPSVKRSICKKTLHLFIEDQNEANWSLLKDNIDLTGDDSRCINEFWPKLSAISPNYCDKYVTYIFDAISKNGSVEHYKKKILKLLKPPVHRHLNLTFLKSLLEEIPFHTTRSRKLRRKIWRSPPPPKDNYYLEFLFHTSEENRDDILEFIFEKLKVYVYENWSDFPNSEAFSNVFQFLRAFCKYSFQLKPKYDFVKTFYDKWKSSFPPSCFECKFLMLEFLNLYSECQYEADEFSKRSSDMLKTFVDRYGALILGAYCKQLEYFRDAADIDHFSFLFGFIEGKSDPITYSATVKMLSGFYPVRANEPKLEKLRSILRNCNESMVKLYLSEYFRR